MPPTPAGATGDRKPNGSAPRQNRREGEPQRRLTGWAAALSRRTGVRRDQPQDRGAFSDVNPTGSPGVGHGGRPLARAVTAQRGEWPRSPASSGGHGARGDPPGRGLALPGRDGEFCQKALFKRAVGKRGVASAGRRRSRRPARTGRGQLTPRAVRQTGNVAGEFTTESTLYRQQGVIQG